MANILVVVGLILLAACGGGKCSGEHEGVWHGSGDQFDLAGDCSFTYTGDDRCKSSGTYGAPLAGKGTVLMDVRSSTGSTRCPAVGAWRCGYEEGTNLLVLNCGGGELVYRR